MFPLQGLYSAEFKIINMRITPLIGSFILGATTLIGAQNASAQDKADSTQASKSIAQDDFNPLIIKTAQFISGLSGNNSIYHKNYVSWLVKQIDNSVLDELPDRKERQKILEAAVREELYVVARIEKNPSLQAELINPLVKSYIKLAKQNNSDPAFLKKSIEALIEFQYFSHFYLDYSKEEELHPDLLVLFDTITDSINKVQNAKDKALLRKQIITTMPLINSFGPEHYLDQDGRLKKKAADKVANLYCKDYLVRLSSFYCKNQSVVDTEEFVNLTYSLLSSGFKEKKHVGKDLPIEMMLQFIENNPEYFEKNIQYIIETYKKSNVPAVKSASGEQLQELYLSFHNLFNAEWLTQSYQQTRVVNTSGSGGTKLQYRPDWKNQISKLETWFNEKLERPLIETILLSLEDEVLKNKGTYALKDWRQFNEKVEETVRSEKSYAIIRDIVTNQLKTKAAPDLREILYETLSPTIRTNKEYPQIISLLRDGISNEENPQAIRGIGKLLFFGTVNNSLFTKKGINFTRALIFDSFPSETSGFYKLTIDLTQVLEGNLALSKSYLPDNSFIIGKDGKVNPKDIEALMRLRKNAFLGLAYLASNCSDEKSLQEHFVKSFIVNLLEKRLERYGTPKTWGEEAAALIDVYAATKTTLHESNLYVNSKLDFLRKRLLDGIEEIHEIDGEKKRYVTTPLFNRLIEGEFMKLNQTENGKFLDKLYKEPSSGDSIRESIFKEAPKLRTKYTEMKQEFKSAFLKARSMQKGSYLDESLEYLRQMGFRD